MFRTWISYLNTNLDQRLIPRFTIIQLVLSAGINTAPYSLDADGIDRHSGVNWLGHFYVVNILYPLLRKTSKQPGAPAGKIVFESSEMHRAMPSVLRLGSLEDIKNPDLEPMGLYARSKLCMILGVKYGLVEKVIKPNKDNIYALAVHPGTVWLLPIKSE